MSEIINISAAWLVVWLCVAFMAGRMVRYAGSAAGRMRAARHVRVARLVVMLAKTGALK